MISFRFAMLLFIALGAIALATLHGLALAVALLIVSALALKSYVHHLRGRIE